MDTTFTFCIADHLLNVTFAGNGQNDISLLPSFEPFRVEEDNGGCHVFANGDRCAAGGKPLFTIRVDDSIAPIAKERRSRIDTFDTGNGKTTVDMTDDGGYQFIMKDLHDRSCCMLQTNSDFSETRCALNGDTGMRQFGLNNALMMSYAFRSSFFGTLLVHASLVRNGGYGYAFIAKSGTGKSTHTALWLKYIEGSDLMNDDNPIVRVIGDRAFIYGSPWSGKTPCYRNIKAPLGAITKIDRSATNSIERLSPTMAFTQVLPACSSMKWDKTVYRNTYDTVIRLIEVTPSVNILHCRPDEEAARVCHDAIAVKTEDTERHDTTN